LVISFSLWVWFAYLMDLLQYSCEITTYAYQPVPRGQLKSILGFYNYCNVMRYGIWVCG